MSSLKEIEERQQRMYRLIDQMVVEEDMTKMLQIVQVLEQEAKDLQAAGEAFQAKMDKQYGKPRRPGFEVVLTPEQRARIMKATGVAMTTVFIQDQSGALNASMPQTDPDRIERIAMQQAGEKKLFEEAAVKARNEVERLLRELEAQGPLVAEQVQLLRNDPKFREQMMLDPPKNK